MITSETILGVFFLSQIGIGFIGNTLLLVQLNINKPIDFIFTHLILANVMTILFGRSPEIMNAFGVRNFLDDIGCKAVMYMYRVTQGLSLCTMSFLSIFQTIIIIPSNSRWAWLKPKISTYIFSAFFSFWVIDMLIYIHVIPTIVAPFNTTEVGQIYSLTYCNGRKSNQLQQTAFLGGMVLWDFPCVFLMIWTSVYMVKFLFTHCKIV